VEEELYFIELDHVKTILNEDMNLPFKNTLIRKAEYIENEVFCNIDSTRIEILTITKEIKENLSLKDIGGDEDLEAYISVLNDLDQYRIRIYEIFSNVQSDYIRLNGIFELLSEIWVGNYSTQKSQDKRKGDALQILEFLEFDRIKRKDLFNIAKNALDAIGAKMEIVSRKITLVMEVMKQYKGKWIERETLTPTRSEGYKEEEKPSKKPLSNSLVEMVESTEGRMEIPATWSKDFDAFFELDEDS